MDLNTMRSILRRDLKDEDPSNYRWSDDELDRHIAHAVKEFSEALPLPAKATLPTTSGSRVIDVSSLTDRVMVEAVEYPLDTFPPGYQRFALWGHALTLLAMKPPMALTALFITVCSIPLIPRGLPSPPSTRT